MGPAASVVTEQCDLGLASSHPPVKKSYSLPSPRGSHPAELETESQTSNCSHIDREGGTQKERQRDRKNETETKKKIRRPGENGPTIKREMETGRWRVKQNKKEREMETYRNGEIQGDKRVEDILGKKGWKKRRKEGGTEGPCRIFTFPSGQEPPSKSTTGEQALCVKVHSQAQNTWCEHPNSLPRAGLQQSSAASIIDKVPHGTASGSSAGSCT